MNAWVCWKARPGPGLHPSRWAQANTPLLLYACLCVNGLMFLMPGLVSPQLPKAFAQPTAYGDLTAVILALVALGSVRSALAVAVPLVWLFNVVGISDLIYANISTFKDHVDPVQLGTTYYLAVLNVPAMVIVHVLIFTYLLRRRASAGANEPIIPPPVSRRPTRV
jgi:hypothetical protein